MLYVLMPQIILHGPGIMPLRRQVITARMPELVLGAYTIHMGVESGYMRYTCTRTTPIFGAHEEAMVSPTACRAWGSMKGPTVRVPYCANLIVA